MNNEVVGLRDVMHFFRTVLTYFVRLSIAISCLVILTATLTLGGPREYRITIRRDSERKSEFPRRLPQVPESVADTSHATYAEWVSHYDSKDVLRTLTTHAIQYDNTDSAVYSVMVRNYFQDKSYLVKRTSTGELRWMRLLAEAGAYVSAIGVVIRNGFIVTASSKEFADSITIELTTYRTDGTLVSRMSVFTGSLDMSARMVASSSAIFLVCSSGDESGSSGKIFKFTFGGDLVWTTRLPNYNRYWQSSFHLGVSPDGSLIVESDASSPHHVGEGTSISHISLQGELLSENWFRNDQGNLGWLDIFVKDAETICLAGTKQFADDRGNPRYHPLILTYVLSGGGHRVSVPDTASTGGLTYIAGALFDSSGRLNYYGQDNFHAAVEFISSNHAFYWGSALSPEHPSLQFETICSAGEGSVALAGHAPTDSLGRSNVIITLFDSTRGFYWHDLDTAVTFGPLIASDGSDRIFLGGNATASHSAGGGSGWIQQTSLDSIALTFNRALAIDPAGNSYSLGVGEPIAGHYSVLAAYDPSGALRWSTKVPSPDEPSWRTSPVKLDDEGNVYFFYAPVTNSPDVLRKMSANGTLAFAETLRTAEGSFFCNDMAVLRTGTSMLLGTLHGSDGYFDAVTKVDSTGRIRWVYSFPGTGDTAFHAQKLLVEQNGRSYVLGYRGTVNTAIATIVALDQSGIRRWQRPLSEVNWYKSIVTSEIIDSVIVVVTSGFDQIYNPTHTMVAIGFDGTSRWTTPLRVVGYGVQSVPLLHGAIGMLEDGPGSALTVTVISKDGQVVWSQVIGTALAKWWYAQAWLTADGAEPIVIAATETGTRIIRFDVDGHSIYDLTDWDGSSSAIQNTALVDAHHLLRIGTTGQYEDGYKMAIVCYDLKKHTLGVSENNRPLPDSFVLDQNYPNPFNPTTRIPYTLPEQGKVSLRVYNVLGQMVGNLVDGQIEEAGIHSALWNATGCASGVYYYHLEITPTSNSGQIFTSVRKAILMK